MNKNVLRKVCTTTVACFLSAGVMSCSTGRGVDAMVQTGSQPAPVERVLPRNAWLRAYPRHDIYAERFQIPDSRIYTVYSEREAHAIVLLEKKSWQKLSLAETIEFVGTKLKAQEGEPYLLRGLVPRIYGDFVVYERDGLVVVTHSALGRPSSSRLDRQPIIVFLKNEPIQVYVETSLAQ